MQRTRTAQPLLTRCGPDELADAHLHLEQLVASAASLEAAMDHDTRSAACWDAAWRMPDVGDGAALCALAHRLARLHQGPPVEPESVEGAVERFRATLVGALDAVRACRQTAHPGGRCWFSTEPDADGCAEVLRLAHRAC